jgi:hypothetical protein
MAARSLLGALALVGCARSPFAAPGQLNARLDGDDVTLTWTSHGRAPGGTWVEMATPGSDFVKLGVAWPDAPRFRHEDVAPATTFVYRLRPFFGQPSPIVAVSGAAGTGPELAEGPFEAPRGTGSASLRASLPRAAPAEVSGRWTPPDAVELRWTDRAGDEDGYLVEVAAADGPFQVCALLPADSTSFRKVDLAAGTTWRFRVRAFFYGAPGASLSVTTRPELSALPNSSAP